MEFFLVAALRNSMSQYCKWVEFTVENFQWFEKFPRFIALADRSTGYMAWQSVSDVKLLAKIINFLGVQYVVSYLVLDIFFYFLQVICSYSY